MGAIHQEAMGNNPSRIVYIKAGIPYTAKLLRKFSYKIINLNFWFFSHFL